MSIGNSIRISSEDGGTVEVGRVNSSRHWTISGNSSDSYIAYNATSFENAKGSYNTVYLGTDGISLGQNFSVDDAGYLEAKDGEFVNAHVGRVLYFNGRNDGQNGWSVYFKGSSDNHLYKRADDGEEHTLATQEWVERQEFLTESDLPDTSDLESRISTLESKMSNHKHGAGSLKAKHGSNIYDVSGDTGTAHL